MLCPDSSLVPRLRNRWEKLFSPSRRPTRKTPASIRSPSTFAPWAWTDLPGNLQAGVKFRCRVFGIPHYGHAKNFAAFTIKEIALQSDQAIQLAPEMPRLLFDA